VLRKCWAYSSTSPPLRGWLAVFALGVHIGEANADGGQLVQADAAVEISSRPARCQKPLSFSCTKGMETATHPRQFAAPSSSRIAREIRFSPTRRTKLKTNWRPAPHRGKPVRGIAAQNGAHGVGVSGLAAASSADHSDLRRGETKRAGGLIGTASAAAKACGSKTRFAPAQVERDDNDTPTKRQSDQPKMAPDFDFSNMVRLCFFHSGWAIFPFTAPRDEQTKTAGWREGGRGGRRGGP